MKLSTKKIKERSEWQTIEAQPQRTVRDTRHHQWLLNPLNKMRVAVYIYLISSCSSVHLVNRPTIQPAERMHN